MTMTAEEALAEAWASIDGKIEAFRKEREGWVGTGKLDRDVPGYTGHYEGYLADAGEMTKRLNARGFTTIPLTPTDEDVVEMARAMAASDFPGSPYEGFHKSWHERFERYARSAYTALAARYGMVQG